MSFTIAIVGRPNVGKSTLFNRLVGRRLALVDDRPGVTRDRREGEAGSAISNSRSSIPPASRSRRRKAWPAACGRRPRPRSGRPTPCSSCIDARAGPMPDDRAFADLVRRSGKPVIVVANKSEGTGGEAPVLEAYELGLGEPVAISAEHGEGMVDLYDALREALPEATAPAARRPPKTPRQPHPIRVAVVGRPNSGKSTLINRLLGEERMLTGAGGRHHARHHRGRTRLAGAALPLARHRRPAPPPRIQEKLEKLSVADTLNAIRFAEVVVLLMDAGNAFEEQDLRIADLVEREGRALVIAINKWDLKEETAGAISKLREQADERLPQVKGVPVVAVSGLTGEGLDRLMQAIVDAYEVWNKRVPTSRAQPLARGDRRRIRRRRCRGARIRLNYMTQAKARPPSFVLFCARADAVPAGLPALSGQRAAREVRPARHADPPDVAREGEPLQGPRQTQTLSAPTNAASC